MTRGREAAERYADRRRREDEAPRLREVVPLLCACRLEISEARRDATTADVSHTRRVVVEHAPALFLIACTDASCRDGGHDISSDLLRGLRDGRQEFGGEDTCFGQIGTADCGRVLRFTAFAEYRPS